MMSQMSHMKTSVQIICTIELHETSHELDDISYMIQKSIALGNLWKYN